MVKKSDTVKHLIVKNCNNIREAGIRLYPEHLNIKYGANGTGKSTIAKALGFKINSKKGDIKSLKPFGAIAHPDSIPQVEGADFFKKVAVFDEAYVREMVFTKEGEVLKNSFEVFIRNTDYDANIAEIGSDLKQLKDHFSNSHVLGKLISETDRLVSAFGKTSDNNLAKNSAVFKGVDQVAKLSLISQEVVEYTHYLGLKDAKNAEWAIWQKTGEGFLDTKPEQCPYCVEKVSREKVARIKKVSSRIEERNLAHYNSFFNLIEDLKEYFALTALENLKNIKEAGEVLSEEHCEFLIETFKQIRSFNHKLKQLKEIEVGDLRSANAMDDFSNKIKDYRINLSLWSSLTSARSNEVVEALNKQIDLLLEKTAPLWGKIVSHNRFVAKASLKYKKEINEFLKVAGYSYWIDYVPGVKAGDGKMVLRHNQGGESAISGHDHLSYGERNAFALILFMYQALADEADLIILDDPISSFDQTKKYAIFNHIFRGGGSFQDKTVLMLSHDIEPIIDIYRVRGREFKRSYCTFLKNRGGIIEEIEIEKTDLLTFVELCRRNINSSKCDWVKLVFLRRLNEILDEDALSYHMLSSLFKRREEAQILFYKDGKEFYTPMTLEQVTEAENEIRKYIQNFSYKLFLKDVSSRSFIKLTYSTAVCSYSKIQIFRLFGDEDLRKLSPSTKKFIDETFHVENDFVMQLDSVKFDLVPSHIVRECDSYVEGLTD